FGRNDPMIGLQASPVHGSRSWWDRPTDAAERTELVAEIAYHNRGGALVTLRGPVPGALFEFGPIEVSTAAMTRLESAHLHAWPLLLRHVACAGAPDATTTERNLRAIRMKEGRVVSEFRTPNGGLLWIITHLGNGGYTVFLVSDDK